MLIFYNGEIEVRGSIKEIAIEFALMILNYDYEESGIKNPDRHSFGDYFTITFKPFQIHWDMKVPPPSEWLEFQKNI